MICYPPAKINLGLQVLRQRVDGFHDIQSVFYPVAWHDILELVPAPDGKLCFTQTGIFLPGTVEDNLVVRAFRLMQQKYQLPPVHIFLHKQIPPGSGLGGGSSDAASMILIMNEMHKLNLDITEMMDLAACLGSDCAFFINPIPCMATGRGEIMQAIEVNLAGLFLVIQVPDIHVSTKEAFAMIKPVDRQPDLVNLADIPVGNWKNMVFNDFEKLVGQKHPEIQRIKESMYQRGAVYAAMSGSGSAIYGIFREPPAMPMPGKGIQKLIRL